MKRFYKAASHVADGDGWRIELDGRPVRTPKRALLHLPTEALAAAVAAEWGAQGEDIDARSMPLTGIANAAIDHVTPDPQAFTRALAAYAETDLVCYRASGPADLAARQAAAWDPVVAFVRRRYDAELKVTEGVVHVTQPAASVERLHAALSALDSFRLAAMQPLVTVAGSLAIALALLEKEIDAAAAFAAGHVDELYQSEKWGDDDEALAARDLRRHDFEAAARFIALL